MNAQRASTDLLAAAAGHTLLAPNTELAAALFDALERAHREAGHDIWPTPRVLDFGSWTREQYVSRQLRDATSPRVLSDVEERELWRSVIDDTPLGAQLLDPAGAARAARRARRTMSEYAIPLRALAAHDSDEVQSFLAWNQAFEEKCRLLGCIGSDALLGRMVPGAQSIRWIDSSLWRPVARQWLARHGRMLAAQDLTGQSTAVYQADSPQDELAAMAEWARENLQAHENFRAWICVPDLSRRRTEVVDAFDAALAPERFELRQDTPAARYAVAGGTPLADYAPVRAALEVLAACSGSLSFAKFSALLRAPELQASRADASAAAHLDLTLRRRATSEADLRTWLHLAERLSRGKDSGRVGAVQRLSASLHALDAARGRHPLSGWVTVWMAALEGGPWSLRARWSSVEYQAAERFRELLATLAMGDAVLGVQSRESAQRILRRAAHDTAFQVQTGVPAIWVSAQLADPWLNYAGIWVSGCSDAQWPVPIAPLALLPIAVQRDYGVISASAQAQLALASDLQGRWQKRAAATVFSYAHDADGTSNAPSPLLPRAPWRAPTVLPQPHWCAQFASAPELETILDEQAPRCSAGERTRGVSTLRAQSRCAFRGFAHTRLDAQPLEQPVPGFNDRERGDLAHHALEYVWSVLRDSRSLQAHSLEALQPLLEEAANRALAKVCAIHDPGVRWRARERVRLPRLLGKWLETERGRMPFRVAEIEHGSAGARFAGLDFNVRIDRMDELEDGSRVLIDYKTGAAFTDWHGERPDNPQLPVYAVLHPFALAAVAYARVNAADPGFVAETERCEIFGRRRGRSSLENSASLADLVGVWARRIERIAGEFAAGEAAVAPTPKACRSCHLHALCRIPAALEPDEA